MTLASIKVKNQKIDQRQEGLDIIVLLKIVERRILIMRKVIWNQMVVGVYLVIN